jgi:hypothetical protein
VTCDSADLRRRQRREHLISPRSSQRKVNRWFGHNAQQNRAKSSVWKYMPVSFLLKIHSSRSNSRSRRLRVVVRDNGCGMDPQVVRSSRHPHWGLLGMRERAAGLAFLTFLTRLTSDTSQPMFDTQNQQLTAPQIWLSACLWSTRGQAAMLNDSGLHESWGTLLDRVLNNVGKDPPASV